MESKIRVRFAPSPTGFLHMGGMRTALYNELFARKHKGDFLLRIEDTDVARTVEGGVENICRSLKAAEIIPNEGIWLDDKGRVVERGNCGPYIQSKRLDKYLAYAKQLIERDKAYYCFCPLERLNKLREEQQAANQPTMYDGACRGITVEEAEKRIADGEPHVIRLKLPKRGNISVWDLIRDEVVFDWGVMDDQIIVKSDGFPTYHLANTCDDHDMGITHVIRGEEWLPSTPKHLFVYEAFGWTPPKFAHLPLLLNPDHTKLSKRQGDVAVEDYLNKGYLPEALINFAALLGWNPTGDRELYGHDELADMFDIAKVNKAGAVFNIKKLDWMNEHYLRSMPDEQYLSLTSPFVADKTDDHAFADRCLLLVRDRIKFPQDAGPMTESFFKNHLDYEQASLTWKKQTKEQAGERLKAVSSLLESLKDDTPDVSSIEKSIKKLIADKGWDNGGTLWPLRVALSGAEKSPTPFELIHVLGRTRSVGRIKDAMEYLQR